jgi:hypothetical protein
LDHNGVVQDHDVAYAHDDHTGWQLPYGLTHGGDDGPAKPGKIVGQGNVLDMVIIPRGDVMDHDLKAIEHLSPALRVAEMV